MVMGFAPQMPQDSSPLPARKSASPCMPTAVCIVLHAAPKSTSGIAKRRTRDTVRHTRYWFINSKLRARWALGLTYETLIRSSRSTMLRYDPPLKNNKKWTTATASQSCSSLSTLVYAMPRRERRPNAYHCQSDMKPLTRSTTQGKNIINSPKPFLCCIVSTRYGEPGPVSHFPVPVRRMFCSSMPGVGLFFHVVFQKIIVLRIARNSGDHRSNASRPKCLPSLSIRDHSSLYKSASSVSASIWFTRITRGAASKPPPSSTAPPLPLTGGEAGGTKANWLIFEVHRSTMTRIWLKYRVTVPDGSCAGAELGGGESISWSFHSS
mmetsp:Transcript_12575/g.24054  ORF Transcript_12575/g.24054 Transcript_12575/m.24054 type:complete len:323 (-) Transcript_12575:90-1058(-)